MSLARSARVVRVPTCLVSPVSRVLRSSLRVMLSTSGGDDGSGTRDMKKKESSQEQEYATRHERQVLQDMLRRMEADADPGDVKAKAALNTIFTQHNIKGTTRFMSDLLQWKHTAQK